MKNGNFKIHEKDLQSSWNSLSLSFSRAIVGNGHECFAPIILLLCRLLSCVHHAQMGTALLSVPAPRPTPFFHCSYGTTPRWTYGSTTSLGFSSSRRISFLSSSSSSSSASVVDEETNSSPPDELSLQSESDPDDSSFRYW